LLADGRLRDKIALGGITETPEAINYALRNADKGELVVILADTVRKDVDHVKQFRDELFASENKL
jgi:hypothetical protein